ncbi:uncharacterized protein J8A68_002030 [[Candida] subhashii]|uniref:Uncharacterized protein n=1 Tax=[Candida] subhashii TaxID=561895 RepID=A0A8J5UR87_9ASCO|nr:uncharacterized protein J8A68_002030 [[Candida] subhashii]KAG7664427.1 hypothetical protein J8A68_002030 [[Candida] subhashii]
MYVTLTQESHDHPENFRINYQASNKILGPIAKVPQNDALPIIETSSKVFTLGAGLGGMASAIYTMDKLKEQDIQIFERHDNFGGTWYVNTYPGVACDIPALWYSFSFALNSNWSRVQPPGYEMEEYILMIAEKYKLAEKTRFKTTVESCVYNDKDGNWTINARDVETGKKLIHTANIVLTCQGGLVQPIHPDIDGLDTFKGTYMHSALWDHSVSFKDKRIIVLGNGCSASQVIPPLLSEHYGAKSITQIFRSRQYYMPPLPKFLFAAYKLLSFSWIGLKLVRLVAITIAEMRMPLFKGNGYISMFLRWMHKRTSKRYVEKYAPKKFHELLIPEFKAGCKRLVFDNYYMPSLNDPRVSLIEDRVKCCVEDGLILENGEHIKADIIVACTGYDVERSFHNYELIGRDQTNIGDLWAKECPSAYRTVMVRDCPNLFMIVGPNGATGHSSVAMAIENSLDYYVKTCKPIIEGKKKSVVVKTEVYYNWFKTIQAELKKSVFGTAFGGCVSWYANEKGNCTVFPWSQIRYWYWTHFPNYKDLEYEDQEQKKTI